MNLHNQRKTGRVEGISRTTRRELPMQKLIDQWPAVLLGTFVIPGVIAVILWFTIRH